MFKDGAIALLIKLCESREEAIFKVMDEFLRNSYSEVYSKPKEYIYAVGEDPIGLVAHLDTVWYGPMKVGRVTLKGEDSLISGIEGKGCNADDRCGLFLIIQAIRYGLKPTIILTCGEEIGGIGATSLVTDFQKPIKPLKFMLELDRHGDNDAAMYDCGNQDFIDLISSFGYKAVSGLYTDICEIGPAWDIACTNLSVGYYNEHTPNECIILAELFDTFRRMINIISNEKEAPYQYYNYQGNDWVMNRGHCNICGKFINYDFCIPYKNEIYCFQCSDKKLNWCRLCGNPYPKDNESRYCPTCVENKKDLNLTSK